jgi:hypothetical protein
MRRSASFSFSFLRELLLINSLIILYSFSSRPLDGKITCHRVVRAGHFTGRAVCAILRTGENQFASD